MTTPVFELKGEGVPAGTTWPQPDTLVLRNRDLRPDTDLAKLSRFSDDLWDLNAAIFEEHYRATSLNFTLIPEPLRLATKHYCWQLLNHKRLWVPRGAKSTRITVTTIHLLFVNELQFIIDWFVKQGIIAFCQVTNELLDAFVDAIVDEEDPLTGTSRTLTEIRRLWGHREILPPAMRLPQAPPWAGEDTAEILGAAGTVGRRENRTRRIAEPTMQMLLNWAIRFLEDFADVILAARAEHAELYRRTPEGRRFTGAQNQTRHQPGELVLKVHNYLDELRQQGRSLPGTWKPSGEKVIRWRHIALLLDCSDSIKDTGTGRLIIDSGLPIGDQVLLNTRFTAPRDGGAWRRDITYDEAPELARLLSTACLVIVAYLSGARAGEVLNLRRGCVTRDTETGLWLMRGLYFKGSVDKDGNRIPEGTVRPDPWVVIEVVAKAVEVLERLHPSPLLFPTRIEPFHRRWAGEKRLGEARSDASIADDLAAFVTWVNGECIRAGRTDLIPDDGRGPLKASRFRRTLAWFIRRRPRGLIAASIQYGHAQVRMLEGYAGTYESGFPDEYAFQDWLYRIECLAEDESALAAGEHVSGPAADAYRSRVADASREFTGRVLTSERQAMDLIGNPLLQIYHGDGMTCVLNPATAACQLRGEADDPMVTPDTDDCRPKCPNLARTDRGIEYVRQQAASLAEAVADQLAPPIRHQRERHELERLQAVIHAHEEGVVRS
ncbi:hypothetical protein [Streptomyces sp. NBC_01262]|uniref:hypothetical protein n=1 Tax=Streptomyces sp. NBC_01262 TaxID=2903803 RepID=UPI002E36C2C2|nr:hypothetical protein [Streptomyces sp. NBC_01262]